LDDIRDAVADGVLHLVRGGLERVADHFRDGLEFLDSLLSVGLGGVATANDVCHDLHLTDHVVSQAVGRLPQTILQILRKLVDHSHRAGDALLVRQVSRREAESGAEFRFVDSWVYLHL